jgi:hypothetical protein
VEWFQIGEAAVNMPNPESEWDKVMAGFRWPAAVQSSDDDNEASTRMQGEVQWDHISRLGGGGQSDVFLARAPARVSERATCLQTIRTALDGDKRADLG